MLAPRVNAYALSSEKIPVPTNGVKVDVNTDDD
jgi:hypothetical protein